MASSSEILNFQCNICGAKCQFALPELGRETRSCANCRSAPRGRAVIDLLSRKFFGESIPLPDFPRRPDLRGLGLSDSNYAVGLAEKFDYQNTYFHRSPHLDIAADLTEAQMGLYDFVISSEIFEHVLPPVDHAFRNVHRLLKPGGLLILTVPYGLKADTTEHFPQLHDFTITGDGDHRILTNRTRTGEIEKFENLVFHGGVGATLEMRVFCEQDLVRRLVQAGFSEITLHQESVLEYGIVWPQLWSRPISAVKPSSLSASEQAA